MTKRIVRILAWIIAVIGVLTFAVVGTIDRSPVAERAFFKTMENKLDTIKPDFFPSTSGMKSGWARVNITPATSMPMAGYSPRDAFDSVHDSLNARILKISNGSMEVAFVNVDLLLFPTTLKARLTEKLDSIGDSPFLYLSATHTHNGVGGWDDSPVGRIAFGTFHNAWVEKTASDIAVAITKIETRPSRINYWEADASEKVENRIDREHGETDGMLRGIRILRDDGSLAVLFTFSAHPTSIQRDSHELSADYPGAVIRKLEETCDFGMFMAGMVGSHRFKWTPMDAYTFIESIAPEIVEKISTSNNDSLAVVPDFRLTHLPIEFGAAQPRISKNLKIRDWFVRMLMRPLQGEATVVEIGNILFIGLPCDFSGEIFKRENFAELARISGKHVIITSFNGDYNGYITYDAHYENGTAEEVNATNWVGPGYGAYFAMIVKSLIEQKDTAE